MKKSLVLFLTMLFQPSHATLLSDRTIPSLRETAVYYIKDTLSEATGLQEHRRNGNVTSVITSGEITTTFTESDDGKEVLTDIAGDNILIKIVFLRPIFSVRDGEQTSGTLHHIERASGRFIKSTPLILKVSSKAPDITIHTYLMVNGDAKEIKVAAFKLKLGHKLPFEIGTQKTSINTDKILSEIILVKQ